MAKAARRGNSDRYEELRAEHDRLKVVHVERSHEEQRAAARARALARRAEEAEERARRWRLPPGFALPLARERAVFGGSSSVPMVPDSRRLALRPWRRGNPASEVIWHPERRR
jgi:hypothetical protein